MIMLADCYAAMIQGQICQKRQMNSIIGQEFFLSKAFQEQELQKSHAISSACKKHWCHGAMQRLWQMMTGFLTKEIDQAAGVPCSSSRSQVFSFVSEN